MKKKTVFNLLKLSIIVFLVIIISDFNKYSESLWEAIFLYMKIVMGCLISFFLIKER